MLAAAPEWWLDGTPYAVRETHLHSGALLAKLEGIDTPEQAKALRGRPVVIPRPAAGEGQYYWSDLVGLAVVNTKGVRLGAVTRMFSNGAHDVMEVAEAGSDAQPRLLPFVPAYVNKVDLPERRIEVEWEADW